MAGIYSSFVSSLMKCSCWSPLITTVRRFERRKYIRRYGYEEKILIRGMLPRDPNCKKKLPIPEYEPKNPWSERRALFGQNDYIDILGSGSETLHPSRLLHNVPYWLRGFRGNEYQMLLRRRKILGNRLKMTNLPKFNEMHKRIKYLYKYLNQKTNHNR